MKASEKYYICSICKGVTDAEQIKKGLSVDVINPKIIPCPLCDTLTQDWCDSNYKPDIEIDHIYTREIVCPYCGDSSLPDHPDWINGETITCDECNKQYDVETNYNVTYCTRKRKQ